MISYNVYKILHIMTLFSLFFVVGFFISNRELSSKKSLRILFGIVSFFVFVAGMGLIARLGFKHGEPFPVWILVKMGAWVLLNVLVVVIIKSPSQKVRYTSAFIILLNVFVAVYTAITKLMV